MKVVEMCPGGPNSLWLGELAMRACTEHPHPRPEVAPEKRPAAPGADQLGDYARPRAVSVPQLELPQPPGASRRTSAPG